jgi:hypothetical protein
LSDKVTTPGSLTGWAHLSARGRRRRNRTSSEREVTAESDKWSRPDREGGGGPRLGWKIRDEAGLKSRKRISELKNWIFEFTKALEIGRRFRRNFDMRIFPKFF